MTRETCKFCDLVHFRGLTVCMEYELIIIVPTDALIHDNAHPAQTLKCKKQIKQYCVFVLLE